jgi:hypothetical protein
MQARKESLGANYWGHLRVDRCERGDRAGGGPAGAAGDRVRHLEGEPAGPGGLAGDRHGGQRHRALAGIQDRLNLNLPQLTTATCCLAVSLPTPPTAMGPSRDEGYSIRAGILVRAGGFPRRTAASAVGGMFTRGRFPGVSARLDRGRCYRRSEGAAASTDADCAPTIVRPGDDCRRLKQCLMTPGTHGIFQC